MDIVIRKRSETATLKISIFDFDERETFLIRFVSFEMMMRDVCVCVGWRESFVEQKTTLKFNVRIHIVSHKATFFYIYI